MTIIWSARAKISFTEILDFLNENWTQKEINNFVKDTLKTISLIKDNPFMYVASQKAKNIRKGFVNKKVSLFYRVVKEKKEIELLLFWDNRKNPQTRKY